MKVRGRFLLLFAIQALVVAMVSAIFAFGAIAGEGARAEAELAGSKASNDSAAMRAFDTGLPDDLRLAAAIDYAESLRAKIAISRVYRSQAAIEAAVRIGCFSLIWAGAAALVFALVSRGFTRRLDELAAGVARVAGDRAFRFPSVADLEFAPVFKAVNDMLKRLEEQERVLSEAAKLEGWKEVSSFLFHQLRTPLSSIELAMRNVHLSSREVTWGSGARESCAESAESALAECARVRALLDRFKSLAGLALAPPTPVDPAELVAALGGRISPDRATVVFSGERAPLFVDRRMVEEALLNLVVNAADACARLPTFVTITTIREGPVVILEVSDDNGPVDPGLFERSGKGRFSTKPDGTGLGLLFVRRVAALHGGGLELFAGGDGGFRARLRLPLAEGAPLEAS